MKKRHISCYQCKFFKVTWQPTFPYSCTAIGFKSKVLPSLEVLKTSGENCKLFTPKQN